MDKKNIEAHAFKLITDFSTPEADILTQWLSRKTFHSHMVFRTAASIKNNFICATVAYIEEKPVGAAGMIPLLDENGEYVYLHDKLVVEFCSNFVHTLHRGKGMARQFIKMREAFAEANDFFSISVTRQHDVVKIFKKLGWVSMDEYPEYSELLEKVRHCGCLSPHNKTFIGERCDVCPLLGRIVWIKKPH